MNLDDIIYLSFLFFSIFFGSYYRRISNPDIKKKIGALVGFLIILTVSRVHFLHIIITILVNAVIILYLNKNVCHIVSFFFSFLYLIFFRTTIYFGIPYPPSHTNLVQMILTLKLVGLAFEVNSDQSLKLNLSDTIYYSLNYIGVLTGPYFKYQTFQDHLYKPFYRYDNYKVEVFKKLFPLVPIYAIIYLFTDYAWPLAYIESNEFQNESFLYRYWYIWPTFLNFRMRIYIGLTLSECVCTMGGLGVYPQFTKNQPGHGPTSNLEKLKEACESPNDLKNIEYDYATVHSINPIATEFYPTLRDGMKNWNMTVQYWLAMCVHKRFPNKKYRTFATMFVSGVWHGVYSGYYISVGMIPFGLIVEDIWVEILLKKPITYLPRNLFDGYWLLLFLKMQFFSYAALAFSLLDVHKILTYYNSVYHWPVPFYLALFVLGKYIIKKQKQINVK
ncbi:hypothetical protein ABEB36_009030 [Hypothenemus hampei]|uniref:Lysophospholipid acyltransferase 7 n=1 Tax=Hypothenemus hampei TaxID=57062 RepID=A0ABD1ER26_HYPHA